MSAHPDRTSFLRRSLPLDGIAAVAAAGLLFAVREVVGLTRLRGATG
jgi:hypothetical protein